MGSKSLAFALALISIGAPRVAGDDSIALRKTELHKHTFAVAGLKLTITRFWTGSFLSRGYIEVKIENVSSSSATYNPQRLSFVSENNRQSNVRSRRQRGAFGHDDRWLDVPQPREIVPGAYMKEFYELDGKIRLPARLFYEGRALALITN